MDGELSGSQCAGVVDLCVYMSWLLGSVVVVWYLERDGVDQGRPQHHIKPPQ